MFYCYLLESLIDKSWYIGYSENLRNRFKSHNKGENKATKYKKPWKLIYYESYADKLDAKKERKIFKIRIWEKVFKKTIAELYI